MNQIMEQRQRTGDLAFSVLLKANTQGNRERSADQGDYGDAVIILNLCFQLALHLVLNLPFHTGIATAGEGTADFNSIHGRNHQSSGPVRAQNPIAFQAAREFASKREYRFRGLPLERVAEGVVANRPDAFGQRPVATLGLDLQQARYLHGGAEEDRVKHLFPGMLGKLPALGQSADQIRKAEHLIEIGLEPVPDQAIEVPSL